LVARPGSPERELDFFGHWARWAVGKTDLQTAEGQRLFRENDLIHKTCARCVQTGSEILAGMLDAPTAQHPAVSK